MKKIPTLVDRLFTLRRITMRSRATTKTLFAREVRRKTKKTKIKSSPQGSQSRAEGAGENPQSRTKFTRCGAASRRPQQAGETAPPRTGRGAGKMPRP